MQNIKANLVVIGGGGAGMPAALTAVEKGITGIVVLDKRHVVGGNANLAGGWLLRHRKPATKEAGNAITRDDIFKEVMAFNHFYRVNPRVVRALIRQIRRYP